MIENRLGIPIYKCIIFSIHKSINGNSLAVYALSIQNKRQIVLRDCAGTKPLGQVMCRDADVFNVLNGWLIMNCK